MNLINLHIWQKKQFKKFARFARAFYIFATFSFSWHDLICGCLDDVTIWCCCLISEALVQFNSRIVRTHIASEMTEQLRNDFTNAKLHFQMTFALSSTWSLLKLREITKFTVLMTRWAYIRNRLFSLVHFVFPIQIMWQYSGGLVLCFAHSKERMQAWICLHALFLMNKTKDRTS